MIGPCAMLGHAWQGQTCARCGAYGLPQVARPDDGRPRWDLIRRVRREIAREGAEAYTQRRAGEAARKIAEGGSREAL